MRKQLLILGFLALSWTALGAQEITPIQLYLDTGLSVTGQTGPTVSGGPGLSAVSNKETIGFGGNSALFDAEAQISVNDDGKYGADIANFSTTKSFFNNYILIDKGDVTLHWKPVDLQAGRYQQFDAYDSPYSLFLNSEGHSALGMRIHYADQFFEYESRWVSLSMNSSFGSVSETPPAWQWVWVPDAGGEGGKYQQIGTGVPDRGTNLHTYLFKFGDTLKVGLQDAAVYSQRAFDSEYFLSPIPEYFTQYFRDTSGRPWTTSGNDNYLMGFFTEWKKPTYELGAQVLIDDFSLHFLFPSQVPNNPWKAAWSLGGKMKTDWGWFGFYHAGAVKDTFEPITTMKGQDAQSAYGYTYLPDVEFSTGSGSFKQIDIADNAVGYLYGENNGAFRVTYDNTFGRDFHLSSYLEFLLMGNNSPANPWQDVTGSGEAGGTLWLDGTLQKSLVLSSTVTWKMADSWQLFATGQLGFIWNILGLQNPTGSTAGDTQGWSALDNFAQIYKPSGSSAAVVNLTVGVTGRFDLSVIQKDLTGAL